MYSLIIPIYKNEESIRELVKTIGKLNIKLDGKLEAVFVIDGSPDQSFTILNELLPQQKFASQLNN
jgi:glycosyltransferase involved in cell wall biosynthesis